MLGSFLIVEIMEVTMKIAFTKEQEEFLKKIGITFSVQKKLDEEHLAELDMVVTDYLIEHGINEDESVNEVGKMCEEILAIISEL
jgi:hemerythrin